ncbi:MAG: Cys-tRNA(Pro) deacylase [Bacteroidota bacterium]|nr:Cys-tRNA(Pro) deacylase [Bacteroidota bacterium]MDP4274555.1 Cys-tRNA(Pro) deacylase [Bacteroidota bacterium]
MNKKTNAVRMLDKLGITYEIVEYEVDENDLSAVHIAKEAGMSIEQVFKTLVVRGDKTGIYVACIPGGLELNLKEISRLTGNKKSELVHVKELLNLTGYIRGGCSPIGMKKSYPTFLDGSALKFSSIFISAGQRGLQIKINPKDLQQITGAKIGIIAE